MHRSEKDTGPIGRENWYYWQYVNRIIKKPDGVVKKTFISMMEVMGYDIELTNVKRKTD